MRKFRTICGAFLCPIIAWALPTAREAAAWPLANSQAQLLVEKGFDTGTRGQQMPLPDGWQYRPQLGHNGTGALVYALAPRQKSCNVGIPIPGVKPGKVYTVQVAVWTSDVNPPKRSGNFGGLCVEFTRQGKWAGGVYPQNRLLPGQPGWRTLACQFALKPGTDGAKAVLYLRKPFHGTVRFDDLRVLSQGDTSAAIVPVRPMALTFQAGEGQLVVQAHAPQVKSPALWVEAQFADGTLRQQILSPTSQGYVGNLGQLPLGKVKVQFKLLDLARRQAVLVSKFNYNSVATREGTAARTLDARGRLCVAGKPYLPIGIFATQELETLSRVAQAGFNTVVIYGSTGLHSAGQQPTQLASIKKALDLMQQKGLSLIFSLKDQYPGKTAACTKFDQIRGLDNVTAHLVRSLRHHPALLGWYLSDEDVRSSVPQLVALREKVSALDPDHPTFTLSFRPDDFPYYAISGDISCFDDYPIRPKQAKHLRNIALGLEKLALGGTPAWTVVQVFNWGTYRAKNREDYFKNYRFPTRAEIRAMTLLPALRGARGFLFYSDFDLWKRAQKFDPQSSPREWRKVEEIVQLLHQIEPFLISESPPKKVAVTARTGAPIEAREFRNASGERCVIAVAHGPGLAQGRLKLPGHWKSQYGLCRKENQHYVFKAQGMNADILIEERK